MACWRVGLSGAVWDGRSLLSWSCGGEDLRWRRDFAAVGDGGHEQRVRAAQSACGQRWAEQSGGAGARGWCTSAAHGNGSVERRRRWRMAARSRETEEEERPAARGQEIYDKWALQNSLTPVDPTSRV